MPVLGVVFIGHAQPETERVIGEMGEVRILGRLPWLEILSPTKLKGSFETAFSKVSFLEDGAAATLDPVLALGTSRSMPGTS